MKDIVVVSVKNQDRHSLKLSSANQAKDLLDAFLSGKSPHTLDAYRTDLEIFQEFIGATGLRSTVAALINRTAGEANHIVLTYRNHLTERGLQPATVNRRLASLRSLVKLARTLGLVGWSIEIQNIKSRAYRDTRGPGLSSIEATLKVLTKRRTPKGIRDFAIIHLFSSLALRVSELTGLDFEHLDLPGKRVFILGKGRAEREWLNLPDSTIAALDAWLEIRGREAGPVFTNFDRSKKVATRITRNGVYKVVRRLGRDVGAVIRPHGIRHSAISAAVKLAQEHSITLREVMQFSRHASLSTLQIYADQERNVQGQLATLVSDRLRIR